MFHGKQHFSCPNPECIFHAAQSGPWFIRKGSFRQRWSGQRIPRFQCKACKTKFSTSSFKDTFRQHKPYLNKQIFRWYSNSASQRQIAENLQTTRRTVIRKFRLLADKARVIHVATVLSGRLATPEVQFDEQETFLRTKKLPLSIAIAVDGRFEKGGGRIIDLEVGSMPARSRNARASLDLYGPQVDERAHICQNVLRHVGLATGEVITITTDAKPQYKGYIAKALGNAEHRFFVNGRKEMASRWERHPLWWINQACGANRHDISRLRRKTCVTTKNVHELRRHLWLYVAHRNGYERDLLDPLFTRTRLKPPPVTWRP